VTVTISSMPPSGALRNRGEPGPSLRIGYDLGRLDVDLVMRVGGPVAGPMPARTLAREHGVHFEEGGMAGILFVSHDAAVTGAPMLLLTLLEWWGRAGGPQFKIVLRGGGRLEARFRQLGPVLNLDYPPSRVRPSESVRADLSNFCGSELRLVYANTAAVGDVLEALDPLGAPVLGHVHELEAMLTDVIGPERFALLKQRATRFVVPARIVAHNLTSRHGIAPDAIDVIPEFLPDDFGRQGELSNADKPAAPVVLGVGTTDWRKGPDLFVEVAAAVYRKIAPSPTFVWVGGETETGQLLKLREAVGKTDLAGRIEFVGEQADVRPFYRSASVFVSSSREDPFPVVCLEAAAYGLPIVCFEGAGGISDFVRNDAGRVVPQANAAAMADAVVALLTEPRTRSEAGSCGRARVDTHHRVSICGPRLLQLACQMMRPMARSDDER
jgi:glycosyltransferase involved in cell wall biosynthesis